MNLDPYEKYFASSDLAESSKRMYMRKLFLWDSFVEGGIEKILKNPEWAFGELKKAPIKQSVQNWHVYLNACYSAIIHGDVGLTKEGHKTLREQWQKIQHDNSEPLREHYKKEEPTELQKGKQLSWTDVLKVRDSLKDGNTKLLLSMYTMLNPERADYFECELIRSDETPTSKNYIKMDTGTLVLRDFKTKKAYTALYQTVPKELLKQITKSLTENPRRYLFVKYGTTEPHSRATFSSWANKNLSKVFGKKTTLTCLRHSFISTLDFNGSLKELDAIATSMGHSTSSQRKYMWKDKSGNEIVAVLE